MALCARVSGGSVCHPGSLRGGRASGDGGEADLGEPPAVQRPAGGGQEAAQAGGARASGESGMEARRISVSPRPCNGRRVVARKRPRQEAPVIAQGDQLTPRPLLRHELRARAIPQGKGMTGWFPVDLSTDGVRSKKRKGGGFRKKDSQVN
jgi:hypothetical protein